MPAVRQKFHLASCPDFQSRLSLRHRLNEEKIIRILREYEAGSKMAGVCRQHGIKAPTFYHCKPYSAGAAGGWSCAVAAPTTGCATLEPKYTALLIPIRIWKPCGIS